MEKRQKLTWKNKRNPCAGVSQWEIMIRVFLPHSWRVRTRSAALLPRAHAPLSLAHSSHSAHTHLCDASWGPENPQPDRHAWSPAAERDLCRLDLSTPRSAALNQRRARCARRRVHTVCAFTWKNPKCAPWHVALKWRQNEKGKNC